MASNHVAMLVRDVPIGLRRAIAKDAKKEGGVPFGSIVGKILGEQFGVPVDISEARKLSGSGGTSPNVTIRVPAELRTRIRVKAAQIPNGTVRGVVIDAIARHYGARAPAPTRRKRQKTNRLASA